MNRVKIRVNNRVKNRVKTVLTMIGPVLSEIVQTTFSFTFHRHAFIMCTICCKELVNSTDLQNHLKVEHDYINCEVSDCKMMHHRDNILEHYQRYHVYAGDTDYCELEIVYHLLLCH